LKIEIQKDTESRAPYFSEVYKGNEYLSPYFMAMGRLINVAAYRIDLLTHRLCRYCRVVRIYLNTAAHDHSVWNRAYATHNRYTMRMNVTMSVVSSAQCEGAATTHPTYRSCGFSFSSSM